MKMKKLIVAFLMAGMLLTACGKDVEVIDSSEATMAESTPKEESVGVTQKEETTESSAVTSEAPIPVTPEEVRPLQLSKDCKRVTYMDSETYEYYMVYEDERILLTDEEAANYPALAAALAEEVNKRNSTYQAELDSLIVSYNEKKEQGNDTGFKVRSKMHIERADSVVLSIRDSASDYIGGDHGIYDTCAYNYDTQTGRNLKFSDVVSDPVAFLKLANDKIQEPFSGEYETPASLEDYYENYDTSIIWTVNYQGVKVYFNTYALGSYALGAFETEIDFTEAPEVFNPKYLNLPESYVVELETNETTLLDIDSDGEKEEIRIASKYSEYPYLIGADLTVDGRTISLDGEPDSYYYVSNRGKNYIFVFIADEGGYWTISSIDLNDMSIDPEDEVAGFLGIYSDDWNDEGERYETNQTEVVFNDPNKVWLSTYIHFLGSMTGQTYYGMGEETQLIPKTEVYSIDMNSVLTASLDIECEQVDLDGNFVGITVIPRGTGLVVRRGDGKSFADLIEVPSDAIVMEYDYFDYLESELYLEDAPVIYRVWGEQDEYGYMTSINGQEEYLVFDKIMYAD